MPWSLEITSKLGDFAKVRLPTLQAKTFDYWTSGVNAQSNAAAIEKDFMSFNDAVEASYQRSFAGQNFSAASRYGFFAASAKVATTVGKYANGLEWAAAGYKIYQANTRDRTKVIYEQSGGLIGGYIGRGVVRF